MTATDFIDTTKLATAIEEAIVREFQGNFARVSGTDEDLGMQSLYISDTGDALEVCRYMERGEWRTAREKLRSMDTLPRENLYFLIERVAGSDFVDSVL